MDAAPEDGDTDMDAKFIKQDSGFLSAVESLRAVLRMAEEDADRRARDLQEQAEEFAVRWLKDSAGDLVAGKEVPFDPKRLAPGVIQAARGLLEEAGVTFDSPPCRPGDAPTTVAMYVKGGAPDGAWSTGAGASTL